MYHIFFSAWVVLSATMVILSTAAAIAKQLGWADKVVVWLASVTAVLKGFELSIQLESRQACLKKSMKKFAFLEHEVEELCVLIKSAKPDEMRMLNSKIVKFGHDFDALVADAGEFIDPKPNT